MRAWECWVVRVCVWSCNVLVQRARTEIDARLFMQRLDARAQASRYPLIRHNPVTFRLERHRCRCCRYTNTPNGAGHKPTRTQKHTRHTHRYERCPCELDSKSGCRATFHIFENTVACGCHTIIISTARTKKERTPVVQKQQYKVKRCAHASRCRICIRRVGLAL